MGNRRPLIGICTASKLYGSENVYFEKPSYVENGCCPYCGCEVLNKRRVYCCDEHARMFQNLTVWNRGRGAYSTRILYRDNFTCQVCGEFHAYKVKETGVFVPVSDGHLDVHHKIFVSDGGDDSPDNLITLCDTCHKLIHAGKISL